MTLARFSLQNSLGRVQFFKETLLLANNSMEVVLRMLFLAPSNADFQFDIEELTWRSYTSAEGLFTTTQVKLIDKRELAKVALDGNFDIFVVDVAVLEVPTTMSIHLFRASHVQDNPAQIIAL